MDAAAKKLLKKQERLKKKAKAAARKQSKQPPAPGGELLPKPTKVAHETGAAVVRAPKPLEFDSRDKFLTPAHPRFDELLAASYQGFVHEPAATVDASFHRMARKVFETLRDKSYFQYDVVMAGGKNLSRTFVRRTLVGDPGMTYKYLGLRIFAHSWTGPRAPPWFQQVHKLNQQLVARTKRTMQHASNQMGSADYNITLINYMEPLSNWDLGLKDEETYGLGKTSVSWHADSSLQDFSAIAVYNCMMDDRDSKKKSKNKKRKHVNDEDERDWRIALRVSPEPPNESGVKLKKKTKLSALPVEAVKLVKPAKASPPVAMATRDGDTYYLLGDFNHDHQHMVLTGSAVRVSSTHRVAVDSDSTLASIVARVEAAYDVAGIETDSEHTRTLTPQQVLKEQGALTELEIEWIRQYWLQGKQHDVLHVDWQNPMRELEMVHWRRLEVRTRQVVDLVLDPDADQANQDDLHTYTGSWNLSDRRKVLNVLLQELVLRQKRRAQFRERVQDKAYRRIAAEYQPVERPRFNDASPMPYDLAAHIERLVVLKQQLMCA